MTEEEDAVLKALAEAWNKFLLLEVHHEDDRHDFSAAIHAAQNIVLARAGIRALRSETEPKSLLHKGERWLEK